MVVACIVKEVQLSTEIRGLAGDVLKLLPSDVAEAILARKFSGKGSGLTKTGAPASLAASDPLGRGELGVVQKLVQEVKKNL